MSEEEFIISVYCWVAAIYEQIVGNIKLRPRGFPPKLSAPELITMELVGEFLGKDSDKAIWYYFKTHWSHYFPTLGSRSNFAKQSANLWHVKQLIHQHLLSTLQLKKVSTHLIDGFPIPVCHYARSKRHRLFNTTAAFGYCASKDEKYYGFKGNLLTTDAGLIVNFTLTAANVDERTSLFDVIDGIENNLLGDMGFIGEDLQQELAENFHIHLQTPKRKNMFDDRDKQFLKHMKDKRRLIETVIGQLVERFSITKIRARDLWHLTNRIGRKLLAHTVAAIINLNNRNKTIQFDGLIGA